MDSFPVNTSRKRKKKKKEKPREERERVFLSLLSRDETPLAPREGFVKVFFQIPSALTESHPTTRIRWAFQMEKKKDTSTDFIPLKAPLRIHQRKVFICSNENLVPPPFSEFSPRITYNVKFVESYRKLVSH